MKKRKWNIKKYKYHKPEREYEPFPEITNSGLLIKQYNPKTKKYDIIADFTHPEIISADKISVGNIWRDGE